MLERLKRKGYRQLVDLGILQDFVSLAREGVVVLTHLNADPDAVASSLLMREVLLASGVEEVVVAFPEGMSRLSRRVLSGLDIRVDCLESPVRHVEKRPVVAVDVSNCNQLGAFCSVIRGARCLMVVDHHIPPGDLVQLTPYSIVQREPASTILVYHLARLMDVELDAKLLTLTLIGILFDSRRFVHVTPTALRVTAELLERGADYRKALSLLEERMSLSERIARLKGAQRSSVVRYGDYLVAVSEIGSYEASVARALISLGADVAIVARERGGECRVSIRVSSDFRSKTGVSVGRDLAASLAEKLGGEGGGHDMAGGFNGKCSAGVALREALRILANKIGGMEQ